MAGVKYNSFDVFDTLIGRLCYKSTNIFDIMEIITGIHKFSRLRVNSESCSLEETYEKISKALGYEANKLKELELKLEYDFSFPIWKYINMISQDDIMISDMYLSEDKIRSLINKHKNIINRLIVTPGGKLTSTIWRDKSLIKDIKLHIGDNIVSDYNNPRLYNVPSQHISNIDLNTEEIELSKVSNELSYIVRAIRLTTQDNSHFFNHLAYSIMIPFSIMISLYINSLVKSRLFSHVIFLSRDGYWIHEIFKILFPSISTRYMYFSRLLINNQVEKDKFIKSVNMLEGSKLIVDLNGTGNTINSIINSIKDASLLLCFTWNNKFEVTSKNMNILYTGNSWINTYIEDIFSAPHGSCIENNKVLQPEYDIRLLTSYMNNIEIFRRYYTVYSKYIDIIKNIKEDHIITCFNNVVLHKPLDIENIHKYIRHVNSHDTYYKEFPLLYYSQIGQDRYYIEQVAKFKCNGIFLDIGAYDGITGSNSYFLEKNLNWKGLLIECNPEIVNECRKNRNAYICDKAIYKESNTMIDFIIPRGKEITGGKAQLSGIKDYLREESISCFNESYKEHTIIKVATININELLEQYDMYIIDYMSLDIEGYELEILKQIDFNKYKILYLTVDHACIPRYQNEINTYLLSQGYILSRHNNHDDEYILPRST